eukprot:1915432-Pyramimonas_sp.AAC.1
MIEAAIESGCPLWVLRLLIFAHRMPRALGAWGSASDVICAEQTIVPGCHCATVMLQLLMLGPLRQGHAGSRRVMLSASAGDFGLQRHGAP